MSKLQEDLKVYSTSLGIDLLGVADITDAADFIRAQGGEYLGRFPRAISIGMRLLDAVVNELHRHEEPPVLFTYRGLYNSVNANLDRAALLIAKRVQDEGFEAYPIQASGGGGRGKLEGAFSHKLAANLAGLGWIGKSCLLITPEYGPRLRFATILTDAPMPVGSPLPNRCGECRRCVDICPAKAFTGVPFKTSEPRDVRFKAQLCSDYTQGRAKQLGEGICGLCVYVCPHGSKTRRPKP